MSSFPIKVIAEDRNLNISWTNDPNVRFLDITLRRGKEDTPYFTKRVSSDDHDAITLTPEDYAPDHSNYAMLPRWVVAYPVLAPSYTDAHEGLPVYKRWNEGPVNNFGVPLGKDTSLAPWRNLWGTSGLLFDGVMWTGNNKAIASTGDSRACNHVSLDLGQASTTSGGAITAWWSSWDEEDTDLLLCRRRWVHQHHQNSGAG
ncbi:hypothetical protein TWF481_008899 [Arthrobotrys musiformis]|uniref:Uncharacterized protein n=1 Tax=Arthrobotrys musiformis TaxID=47236 RepID=A0AAV9W8J3_9PEZI